MMSNILVYEEKRRAQGRQLMGLGSLIFLTSAVLSCIVPNNITITVAAISMILSLGIVFFGCGLHLYAYCFCCGPLADPEGNTLYDFSEEPVKISPMRQQWLGLIPTQEKQDDTMLVIPVSQVERRLSQVERRMSRDVVVNFQREEELPDNQKRTKDDPPPPYPGNLS